MAGNPDHQLLAEEQCERRVKTINGQLEYQRGGSPWKWILLVIALAAVVFAVWQFILPLLYHPSPPVQVPVISSFTANPPGITTGDSSTLSWSVTGATTVTIDPGIGSVDRTGTRTVSPTTTTTYTLTASNEAGSSRTATVQVTVSAATPPVINSFTANPTTIVLGGSSTLSWSVSGATAVTINQGIESVALTGTRTVSPTTTTTYTLTASNAAGSSRTATVQVAMPTVYDFVAKASHSRTLWKSGAGTLTFPGATNDNRGFARYVTNAVLEDNRTYDKVLETHPQWVDNGLIEGTYLGVWDLGYRVQAGDHFYAKVGFLKGASAGNVKFRVMIRLEGGSNTWIAEINDVYDGILRTINVDLSPYANKRADFILEVEANGTSAQDWATWVEAKII